MNDIVKSLFERKSVRAFLDKEVSNEIKKELIDATLQAPSAGNQMMFSIIDVTDQALKDKLVKTCDNQPFIGKAPLVFIFVADLTRWYRSFELANCNPRPLGVGDMMLSVTDTTIAAQNMVVAAESYGLGSCYIGDVLENREEHRALLNLPMSTVPVCMLVLGYPAESQVRRKKPARFDAKYVVGTNTYPLLSDEQLVECYVDREERGILKTVEAFETYMDKFCKRKYNSEFSEEMTRSVSGYIKEFEMKD